MPKLTVLCMILKMFLVMSKQSYYLLIVFNDCISIDIVLEQRCAKFIWSCLNSYNTIIKNTALSAISSGGSTFGDNYRYLGYKYNIGPHIWMLSLNEDIKCISLYISTHKNLLHSDP